MADIVITLTDQEIDLFVQPHNYTSTISVDSGKIDIDGNPIMENVPNISKLDYAVNIINGLVFSKIKDVTVSNLREANKIVLDQTIKVETDKIITPIRKL